jgi:hypothetical protein
MWVLDVDNDQDGATGREPERRATVTNDTYYPLFASGTRLGLEDLDTARRVVEDAVLEDGQRAEWSHGVSMHRARPRLSLWFHVDGEVARVRLIGGSDGFLYVDVPLGDEATGALENRGVPGTRVLGLPQSLEPGQRDPRAA